MRLQATPSVSTTAPIAARDLASAKPVTSRGTATVQIHSRRRGHHRIRTGTRNKAKYEPAALTSGCRTLNRISRATNIRACPVGMLLCMTISAIRTSAMTAPADPPSAQNFRMRARSPAQPSAIRSAYIAVTSHVTHRNAR